MNDNQDRTEPCDSTAEKLDRGSASAPALPDNGDLEARQEERPKAPQMRTSEQPRIQVQRAQWDQGNRTITGYVIISSTGEIVTRIPKHSRPRERNKYNPDGSRKTLEPKPEPKPAPRSENRTVYQGNSKRARIRTAQRPMDTSSTSSS